MLKLKTNLGELGRTNALIEAVGYTIGDIIVNLSSDGNEKHV